MAAASPRRLVSLYLLVAVALGLLGGGAATALRDASSARYPAAAVRCLAERGIDSTALEGVDSVRLRNAAVRDQVWGCISGNARNQSRFMLLGALLLPVAALLLMVGGGLAVRRRLAGHAVSPASGAASRRALDRFEQWCDLLGLTGRRRPRLVITPPSPAGRQAFTTGLPFRSPVVVVPLGHAYLEPAQFDVLVLHELAHVRARDVVWASAVWWTGWLSVPVLLLALSPLVRWPHQRSGIFVAYLPALLSAVVLSAVVLGLRAALLRRREIAADRYAVDVLGSAGALRAVLGRPQGGTTVTDRGTPAGVAGPVRRAVSSARRNLTVHPPAAVRADADPVAPQRWEGGFAVTAVAGVLAMFTVQSAYIVLSATDWAWRSGRLALNAAAVLGGLLWACVVVPAWRRRARIAAAVGSAPRWSGPIAGAVLGTVAGLLTQAPGGIATAARGLVPVLFAGHLMPAVGVLTAVTAGTAVLTAGLAAAVPAPGRAARAWSAAGAIVAVVTAWATAFTTSVWTLVNYFPDGSPSRVRTWLMGAGLWEWRWAPLLVLTGSALAALAYRWIPDAAAPVVRSRWPGRAGLRVTGVAVVVGGLAAGLTWQLRIGAADSEDALFVLMSDRSMICACAGWAALAVLLFPHPSDPADRSPARVLPQVPSALAAGFATAALAGVVLFGIATAGGRGRDVDALVAAVRWPMWQLLVAVVVTLPALVALAGRAHRLRRRTRGWAAGAGTGVVIVAFSMALVGGAIPPLAVGPHDWSDYLASRDAAPTVLGVRPTPPAATDDPGQGRDPGRPLDAAAVTAALAGIDNLLPAGHRRLPDDTDGTDAAEPLDLRPEACRAALARSTDAERARPRTADAAQRYKTPLGPYADVTVEVGIVSYREPVPDFTRHREATAQCGHLTMPSPVSDTGTAEGSYTEGPPPRGPYPAFRTDFTLTASVRSLPVVTMWLAEYALAGHNLVSVSITMSTSGGPPTEAARLDRDQLAEALLNDVLHRLRQPG
ncbi:M48 family metalloprotease [Actinoplanes sp. NPDC049599]|uniref:M48 family metalloprotease n=1 Tax=Actinoplanes sp. NPDC049599 TaxID=3363903 RepID=UPI003799D040